MNTYLTVEGSELTLTALGDRLARTCLALHGLRSLILGTLSSRELGEIECGRLTVAQLALETITQQTEYLLPDLPESIPMPVY